MEDASLTTKQDIFVKNLLTGKSAKQSAIEAGYSKRSAESIASENLRKPKVKQKITRILDKAGLTDEKVASYLNTVITSGVGEKPKNSDALKGLKLVYELRGYTGSTKSVKNNYDNRRVGINYNVLTKDELRERVLELDTQLKKYL